MIRAAEFADCDKANILLIRFKCIGDVVFTLPAVHAVRKNFPDARIVFLTSKENEAILEGFHEVNEVITVDRSKYKRGNPLSIVRETLSLIRRVRRGRFSLVVDFQGYGETALLARLTSAPQRWGFANRGWAYTKAIHRNAAIHHVEANLSLLQQCGLHIGQVQSSYTPPRAAFAEARRWFIEQGLDPAERTIFIQPFTSTGHKNWPIENYLELARYWKDRGVRILFGGGASDQATLEPVRHAGFLTFAGKPIPVVAGLVKLCDLVLGGDTGIVHLAVAMHKRVIMLMAPGASRSSCPFQHAQWVITPAFRESVSTIRTEIVIAACAEALSELGPGTLPPDVISHTDSAPARSGFSNPASPWAASGFI